MKFPDNWAGGNLDAAGTPPRTQWRASATRWILLAVAVTGSLVWASQALPGGMSFIMRQHDVPKLDNSTPPNNIHDNPDGNVTQSAWPMTSSWEFIGYDHSACPLNPPNYPVLWTDKGVTQCIDVKSKDKFKYYKFLSTVGKDSKEVDFKLCYWERSGCSGTPVDVDNEVLCSDAVKIGSWGIMEFKGRLGAACKFHTWV